MLHKLFSKNNQFEIEEENELEEEVSIEEQQQVWGGFNNLTEGAFNMATGFATGASAPVVAGMGVAYGGAQVGWWLGNNAVPQSVIDAGADAYADIAY